MRALWSRDCRALFVVGAYTGPSPESPTLTLPKRGGNGGWVADKEMMEGMVAGLLIK